MFVVRTITHLPFVLTKTKFPGVNGMSTRPTAICNIQSRLMGKLKKMKSPLQPRLSAGVGHQVEDGVLHPEEEL